MAAKDIDDLPKNAANYAALTPLYFLERAALIHPHRKSIIHDSIHYTWHQTHSRCRQLASALLTRSIGLGSTVAVIAPNIPAMYEAHFGVPMAGAVLNSVNIRLNAQTIAFLTGHSQTNVIMVDQEFFPLVEEALRILEENGREKFKRTLLVVIADASCGPKGLEYALSRGAVEYESFLETGDPNFVWKAPEDEWQSIALGYTSGTTASPKGVVLSHRGAYLTSLSGSIVWGMQEGAVYLWTLPMFHCNGWCYTWTLAAICGTSVCLRQFFVRASAGRFVTRVELKLMMMVDRELRVDWLDVLTRGLEENSRTDVRNQAVGGGSFITWIARKLNFTFGDLEVRRDRLHLAKMRSCHILGRGLTFKNARDESESENFGSEDEEPIPPTQPPPSESARPTAPHSDIPSSSTQPPPSTPSSLEQKLDTLLALAKEQRVFQGFVMDHLRWSERTLTTIVTHLDLQSKVDSPPVHPSEPPPPTQSSKGKEKVTASSSTDSVERLADYMTQLHAEVAGKIVEDEESLAASDDAEDDSDDDDEGDSGDMVDVDDLIGRVAGEATAALSPASTTPSASPSTRSTTPTA